MNVLCISHMYPSVFNMVEGIFVHQQLKFLSEQGADVRVISPAPVVPAAARLLRRKWNQISQIPPSAEIEGICVWYPRYVAVPKALFFATSGRRMYQAVRELAPAACGKSSLDLIHAHVALPDGYAAMLLSRDLGIPYVVTIHGADLQSTIHRNTGCRNAISRALNGATKIIVVSSKLCRLVDQYFGLAGKTVVIPNGVNPERVCQSGGEEMGGRTLLSVSNLIPTKGIDLNIEAVSKLKDDYPDLTYRIVGAGAEEKKLRRLAAEKGIADRVFFLGQMPHTRVMEEMAKCTLFSLPSWQEGFGVVYLEAMASGRPVIGCRGEGIEDFVEHGTTGILVEPHDTPGLVEAIDRVLGNADAAEDIGRSGQEWVLDNLTWARNAQKTIDVYEGVLRDS